MRSQTGTTALPELRDSLQQFLQLPVRNANYISLQVGWPYVRLPPVHRRPKPVHASGILGEAETHVLRSRQ